MIGDDIETDVGGGKEAGMKGVLVRTGKFRKGCEENAVQQPDCIMDSLGDLFGGVELLRARGE